jgi:hypothetical protein
VKDQDRKDVAQVWKSAMERDNFGHQKADRRMMIKLGGEK